MADEQITLKRAAFYAKAAQKAATDRKYDAGLKLSIFAPALADDARTSLSDVVDEARLKLKAEHQMSLDLIAAVYAIRDALANANMKHGVSKLLTQNKQYAAEEARIGALIAAYEATKDSGLDQATVVTKAKSLRDKPVSERFIGREDSVTIGLLSEADFEQARKHLRRIVEERASINDALTALNVTHKISLDEKTADTLRRAEILASSR